MVKYFIIAFVSIAVSANAAVTVGVQGGLTHFTEGAYTEESAVGYRGDFVLDSRGEHWGGEIGFRALGFPGGINAGDFALDFGMTYFLFDGATHPYFGPVFGFGMKRVNFDEGPKGPGNFTNNSVRLGLTAGVRHYFRAKYLDVSAVFMMDYVFGNLVEKLFEHIYHEKDTTIFADIAVEAEFFWAFTDRFGVTTRAGIIAENYMLNTEMYKGTDALFFYQVGPSIYF